MKIKRILSMFLMLVMIMAIIPVAGITASAEVWIDDFAYWVDNNGDAHIADFNSSYVGALKIPSSITYRGRTYTVKYIDEEAFLYKKYLKSVEIPSSVILIDEQAFYGCNNLEEIIFNEGLEEIGIEAFYDCSELKTVTFPTTLKEIKQGAFYYCDSLSTVTFNHQLEELGPQAFSYCGNLSKIIMKKVPQTWWTSSFNYGQNKTFYIPCSSYSSNFWKDAEEQEWNATIITTHESTSFVNILATCGQKGYNNREVCTFCNATVKEGTVVAELAHTETLVNAKASTYFTTGYTGDKVCSVCGVTIEKGKAIAKLTLQVPKFKLTKGYWFPS